jgi:hypothetical protein
MASEGSNFLLPLHFFGCAEFFQQETAQILVLRALCPFSELGFSLTLAVWFTRKGAFTRHRQVDQM